MWSASEEVLNAVRSGALPADRRLAALSRFTHQVVSKRSHVPAEDIHSFLDADFTPAQMLEVLVGVGMTMLASPMYHLAVTPPDAAFQAQAWAPPA
jgi:alkylhydroperoxidase family enzyme